MLMSVNEVVIWAAALGAIICVGLALGIVLVSVVIGVWYRAHDEYEKWRVHRDG